MSINRDSFDSIVRADEAVALARRMVAWFCVNREQHDDAYDDAYDDVECDDWRGPLSSCEPLDTREALEDYPGDELATFSNNEQAEILTVVIEEIEQDGGYLWTTVRPAHVQLLVARDHYWGRGHTHLFREQAGKTLCGLTREVCPGTMRTGEIREINCGSCMHAIKRQRQRRAA
jgi:hypothetical protein